MPDGVVFDNESDFDRMTRAVRNVERLMQSDPLTGTQAPAQSGAGIISCRVTGPAYTSDPIPVSGETQTIIGLYPGIFCSRQTDATNPNTGWWDSPDDTKVCLINPLNGAALDTTGTRKYLGKIFGYRNDVAVVDVIEDVPAGTSSWKSPSVLMATTAPLPANTYANGTLGVGATLTGNANGALPTMDGVFLSNGDDLLVKTEASAVHNGIYTVTQKGDASHPYILTRRSDADSGDKLVGAAVVVRLGTVNANTQWICSATSPITTGVSPINWITFIESSPGNGVSQFLSIWGTGQASGTGYTTPTFDNTFLLTSSALRFTRIYDPSSYGGECRYEFMPIIPAASGLLGGIGSYPAMALVTDTSGPTNPATDHSYSASTYLLLTNMTADMSGALTATQSILISPFGIRFDGATNSAPHLNWRSVVNLGGFLWNAVEVHAQAPPFCPSAIRAVASAQYGQFEVAIEGHETDQTGANRVRGGATGQIAPGDWFYGGVYDGGGSGSFVTTGANTFNNTQTIHSGANTPALELQQTSSDSANTLQIKNSAGTVTVSVTGAGQVAANSFSGDGNAITDLSAAALTTGLVPAAVMPAFTGDVVSSSGTVGLSISSTAKATIAALAAGISGCLN